MINELLPYILHIAPSLAVLIFIVVLQEQRNAKMEVKIQTMLETCIERMFTHLNNEN